MQAIVEAALASPIKSMGLRIFDLRPGEPRTESKLVGYSVSNRVRVKIRQIDQVCDILDRLVIAGATDIGSVEFLVSEPSTALDHAREVAIADARRKAEVYAQASGIRLGRLNGSQRWLDLPHPLPEALRAVGIFLSQPSGCPRSWCASDAAAALAISSCCTLCCSWSAAGHVANRAHVGAILGKPQ
jgi:uncharacterized protein YggE